MSLVSAQIESIKHRFVQVNGIRMHIAEQGEGPLIVVAHGWPELWYCWRHVLPALAAAGYPRVSFQSLLRIALRGTASACLAGISLAQTDAPAPQQAPELMPQEKEMAMALSAGPDHIRANASVYVLQKNGFVLARQGTNGFACIVNRDHPLNQKPTCYDSEGAATILPKVLRVGELLMKGIPLDQIKNEIAEGFKTGKFISPRRPGVAYMLSGDIRNYNPATKQVESFPPHVMLYAPNLTNEDIGSNGKFEPGLPSIAYQGPHGFMIIVLGDGPHSAH